MKLRLTTSGLYCYFRHGMLSVCWRYAWHWLPTWKRISDDWIVLWLTIGLEWICLDDDRVETLASLCEELEHMWSQEESGK